MKLFKKLVGDRIYLSPRNEEAAEIFTEWLNDFETTDYLGSSNALMTISDEKAYFENNISNSNERVFFIVDKKNDKLIGTVGLHKINNINRTAVLGVFIGDKNYRNNGYGTEAIKLILDFGFNYLNLNNIKLDLMEFNERALSCYKKCGFKEYGRRRKCNFVNGKYYDSIEMDILANEFEGDWIRNKNV